MDTVAQRRTNRLFITSNEGAKNSFNYNAIQRQICLFVEEGHVVYYSYCVGGCALHHEKRTIQGIVAYRTITSVSATKLRTREE